MIKLVFDYIKAKSPLSAAIPRESSLALSKDLTLRLGAGEEELDFSPNSLKLLEKLLVNYHSANPNGITDDETMKLVRELAAYVGETLTRHTGGKWIILSDTIWSTEMSYEDNWTLLKEGERRSVSAVAYPLADIAATSWQNALDGKLPQLFKLFQSTQKRELREELTYKK